MRYLQAIALLFSAIFLSGNVGALVFYIAKPDGNPDRHNKLIDGILIQSGITKGWKVVRGDVDAAHASDKDVILAFGASALVRSIKATDCKVPIITVLISSYRYHEIISEVEKDCRVTAIFSDPSPKRQLLLFKSLYGPHAKLSYLVNSQDSPEIKQFSEFATSSNIEINYVLADKGRTNILDSMRESSSILVSKNPTLYKNLSLEDLLLLSYDLNRQSVIGFERSIVKAGAIATTYSTSADVASTLFYYASELSGKDILFPPDHTKGFSVKINSYVAKSLNVNVPSHEEIADKIREEFSDGYYD